MEHLYHLIHPGQLFLGFALFQGVEDQAEFILRQGHAGSLHVAHGCQQEGQQLGGGFASCLVVELHDGHQLGWVDPFESRVLHPAASRRGVPRKYVLGRLFLTLRERLSFGSCLLLALRERLPLGSCLLLTLRERLSFGSCLLLALRERLSFGSCLLLALRERLPFPSWLALGWALPLGCGIHLERIVKK